MIPPEDVLDCDGEEADDREGETLPVGPLERTMTDRQMVTK
jgi:hypothetical protein